MGLPTTSYTISDGGLGRTTPSLDGVSTIPFLNDNIGDLTDFSDTNRIISFNTLSAVERTGITADSTNFKLEYYTLKRFFQMGGQKIYVGIFETTDTYSDAIDKINAFSKGEVRLYGVFEETDLAEANIATLNTKMVGLTDEKKPAHLIYAAHTGNLTFATLPDLRNLTSESRYVSVVISQDSANYPSTIPAGVPDLGGILGALSSTDVGTNILDHTDFNYSQSSDMLIPAINITDNAVANTLILANNETFDKALQDSLNDKGYLFYHFEANQDGVFLSNAHTCAKADSDYAYIQNVRAIQKSLRVADTVMTPYIGRKIRINNDGTIRDSQISAYETALGAEFQLMVLNDEISGFEFFIDPDQKPLATNELNIQIRIQPVPSSDYINVDLGYAGTLG